jgi:RNA polymerase sigma-70 factor (ECF subfamily)
MPSRAAEAASEGGPARGRRPGVLSDADLVAACRAGDEAAWRELVDRFSRYVYAIVVRAYRLEGPDAEDLFQDVFARAYERLDGLRDAAAVRPWLGQLTRNLAVDRLRVAGREVPTDSDAERPDPRDAIDEIDEALSVRDGLARLPETCRELLDRFFARDEGYRTLADALDLPPGTIASRISRCLRKLSAELRKIGHPSFVS